MAVNKKRKSSTAIDAEAQRRYQELFDDVAVGLLRSTPGPEGTFIDVNPAMVAMFEADSREQLMAVHPRDMYLDSDQRRIVSNVIMSTGFIKGEVWCKTLKGNAIWCRITAVKRTAANGEIYFEGTFEDITERKRAEEALRRSEERGRNILETSGAGYFFVDYEGHFRRVNKAWLRMHKYESAEEILGKHFSVTQVDADLAEAHTTVDKMLDGQTILTGEFSRRCKDGSIGYHTFTANPVFEAGKIVGLEGFLIDITDRKYAEEALQRSEERFRRLFEDAVLGLYRTSPDGRILMANSALVRMLGYDSFEDLQKRNLEEDGYAPGYSRSRFKEMMDRQGVVSGLETKWKKADGAYVFVRESARAQRDEDGRIIYYAGTVEDITELKRAEGALRDSEERFRLAAQIANDVIYERDMRTGVAEFYGDIDAIQGFPPGGYPREQAGFFDLLHPDDATAFVTAFREFQATGKPYRTEIRIRRADGAYNTWIDNGCLVFDENGAPLKWIGVATNITERKQAEEELRRANAYNRVLIEASLDPLVTIAPDGKITDVNQATETITGLTRHELIGTDFSNYFAEPGEARTGCQKAFAEGFVKDYALTIRHRDGRLTPVLYNATVYRDEAGQVAGVFAAARDISERRRAEEVARKAHAELENRVLERTSELAERNAALQSEIESRRQTEAALRELQAGLTEARDALAHQAMHDPLTGIFNRRAILDRLAKEISRARRKGEKFSIGMCDIDYFKRINDTHGHQAGDEVLLAFTRCIQGGLREYDCLGRYGGEEFLVIAEGSKGSSNESLYERLRSAVANNVFHTKATDLSITVSIGVASGTGQSTVDDLLAAADAALYQAKADGRNRVVYSRPVGGG